MRTIYRRITLGDAEAAETLLSDIATLEPDLVILETLGVADLDEVSLAADALDPLTGWTTQINAQPTDTCVMCVCVASPWPLEDGPSTSSPGLETTLVGGPRPGRLTLSFGGGQLGFELGCGE